MYLDRVHSTASQPRQTAVDAETFRRSGPQAGDVVVMREPGSPVRYSIRQLPADARVSTSSQDLAIGLARMFAELHEVDVWGGEDRHTLHLLDAYRLQPEARSR